MESIWITGKLFLEINFLRLIHPKITLEEVNVTTCKETEKQSLKTEGRKLFTQVKTDQINSNGDTSDIAVDYEFYKAELHGRTAKTANIGIAIRQIP